MIPYAGYRGRYENRVEYLECCGGAPMRSHVLATCRGLGKVMGMLLVVNLGDGRPPCDGVRRFLLWCVDLDEDAFVWCWQCAYCVREDCLLFCLLGCYEESFNLRQLLLHVLPWRSRLDRLSQT